MIETRRQSVTVTIRRIAGRDKGSVLGDDVKDQRKGATCSNLATAVRNAATSDQQLSVVVGFALVGKKRKTKIRIRWKLGRHSDMRVRKSVPVTRGDGLPSFLNLWVLRQARASAIPIYLLPDFLEVPKEHRRILDVSVRALNISINTAYHTPLTVEVLALQRGFDFALDDVDAAAAVVVALFAFAVAPAEVCGFGTDFGADGLV